MLNSYIKEIYTFLRGNIEQNLDLSVDNKSNVLEKCQNKGYMFYTPMCRELISLLNGIMRYNYDNGESSIITLFARLNDYD